MEILDKQSKKNFIYTLLDTEQQYRIQKLKNDLDNTVSDIKKSQLSIHISKVFDEYAKAYKYLSEL